MRPERPERGGPLLTVETFGCSQPSFPQRTLFLLFVSPSPSNLDLRISPRILGKIRIDPNIIFRSWGKMLMEKACRTKSRDTGALKKPTLRGPSFLLALPPLPQGEDPGFFSSLCVQSQKGFQTIKLSTPWTN